MTVAVTDDLATAVWTHLSTKTELTDLLGSDAVYDAWLFREKLLAVVENTSKSAVVVRGQGSWTTPNPHNTMRFPKLIVELYVDPPRDAEGNATVSTVTPIMDHLYKVVDSYLHTTANLDQMWGTLRIQGCSRAGETEPFPWGDVDGTMSVRISYNVTVVS